MKPGRSVRFGSGAGSGGVWVPVMLSVPSFRAAVTWAVSWCLSAWDRVPSARRRSACLARTVVALAQGRIDMVTGAFSGAQAPMTRYARSGGLNIAYQVFGAGPPDVVLVPGFISHVEFAWQEPLLARFLRKLSAFTRVIAFDKRGMGLSDRDPRRETPSLAERMDDIARGDGRGWLLRGRRCWPGRRAARRACCSPSARPSG